MKSSKGPFKMKSPIKFGGFGGMGPQARMSQMMSALGTSYSSPSFLGLTPRTPGAGPLAGNYEPPGTSGMARSLHGGSIHPALQSQII